MAAIIEPFHKGTSFSDWVERLGYFFLANGVPDGMKKAHLITQGGSVVYSELKLLYPNDDLATVPYPEMIKKLKVRFDRTGSEVIQRYKFNHRVQLPDETTEEFVLGVKVQADLCAFGGFKEMAIVDRIVVGIRDKALQQRLLSEEHLTLQLLERIVATWELTGAGRSKSVKSRLGVKPNHNIGDFDETDLLGCSLISFAPTTNMMPPQSCSQVRNCSFCGKSGHAKKRCFLLKNLKNDKMDDLFKRMKTSCSAADDADSGYDNSGCNESSHCSGRFKRKRARVESDDSNE